MSMLIGAGNALQNFGDRIGQAMLASRERQEAEKQRAFQNMIASRQLDMTEANRAQEQANWERERVLKLISSMPGGQGRVDQATGQALLDKAPDLGAFIKPDGGTLPSRNMGMTQSGGIAPEANVTPGQDPGFNITRPETDAYARALLKQDTDAKNRAQRLEIAKARLAGSAAAVKARMEIAKMTDKTRRDIANQQLDSVMARHADVMAVRNDLSDLAFAKADADVENDFLKVLSNPLNMVPADTKPPVKPSAARRPPRGTAGTAPKMDATDALIDELFNPKPKGQ